MASLEGDSVVTFSEGDAVVASSSVSVIVASSEVDCFVVLNGGSLVKLGVVGSTSMISIISSSVPG